MFGLSKSERKTSSQSLHRLAPLGLLVGEVTNFIQTGPVEEEPRCQARPLFHHNHNHNTTQTPTYSTLRSCPACVRVGVCVCVLVSGGAGLARCRCGEILYQAWTLQVKREREREREETNVCSKRDMIWFGDWVGWRDNLPSNYWFFAFFSLVFFCFLLRFPQEKEGRGKRTNTDRTITFLFPLPSMFLSPSLPPPPHAPFKLTREWICNRGAGAGAGGGGRESERGWVRVPGESMKGYVSKHEGGFAAPPGPPHAYKCQSSHSMPPSPLSAVSHSNEYSRKSTPYSSAHLSTQRPTPNATNGKANKDGHAEERSR